MIQWVKIQSADEDVLADGIGRSVNASNQPSGSTGQANKTSCECWASGSTAGPALPRGFAARLDFWSAWPAVWRHHWTKHDIIIPPVRQCDRPGGRLQLLN